MSERSSWSQPTVPSSLFWVCGSRPAWPFPKRILCFVWPSLSSDSVFCCALAYWLNYLDISVFTSLSSTYLGPFPMPGLCYVWRCRLGSLPSRDRSASAILKVWGREQRQWCTWFCIGILWRRSLLFLLCCVATCCSADCRRPGLLLAMNLRLNGRGPVWWV